MKEMLGGPWLHHVRRAAAWRDLGPALATPLVNRSQLNIIYHYNDDAILFYFVYEVIPRMYDRVILNYFDHLLTIPLNTKF